MYNLSLKPKPYSFVFAEEDDDLQEGEPSSQIERIWLRRFSKLLCSLSFILLFIGAMVTSNNAGLAVPDWPSSFGYNMFLFPPSLWKGGIFYEHVHRLLASLVGLMTVVLAVWLGITEDRKWVRWLSYAGVLMVIAQGALGGITVLYLLPPLVSSSHAVLAQTFFLVTLMLAYSQSKEWNHGIFSGPLSKRNFVHVKNLFAASVLSFLLVYLQLIIGAVMRHTGSGLAVLDFPSMGGSILPVFDQTMLDAVNSLRTSFALPNVSMGQVLIHVAHRCAGIFVLLGIFILAFEVYATGLKIKQLRRPALFLVLVGFLQFILGIYSVFTIRQPFITSLHLLGGALLLGTHVFLGLRLAVLGRES